MRLTFNYLNHFFLQKGKMGKRKETQATNEDDPTTGIYKKCIFFCYLTV